MLRAHPNVELIWASPREVLNIVQADAIGCHIITVTHDLLEKLGSLGRDLDEFSLDTVRMFFRRRSGSRVHARRCRARTAGSAVEPYRSDPLTLPCNEV